MRDSSENDLSRRKTSMFSGFVTGVPRILLRLEGLFFLIVAMAAYSHLGFSWPLFAAMFLTPDLSMFGYLASRKAGATIYNIFHWYGLPVTCTIWGIFEHVPVVLALGLIWITHIGFDRALGYGLKYAEGFGYTHLGSKGEPSRA